MTFWIATVLYMLLAAAASVLTWIEQRNRRTAFAMRCIGFFACMLWPVAIVAMIVAMVAQGMSRRRTTPSQTSVA